ncbi:hypothetical protein [Halocatena salina]|uniref:Uncharacterized protein n=1 Tax=Halocatena salina TaxID=2934340 RepID=A0A8U0A7I7_9EURY|nr:hypothetical protein [Halocatena salina]UPM44809.1 hypothetical protein MW046_15565 [Halocatena salina]
MTAADQGESDATGHESEDVRESNASLSTVALVTGAYRRLRTTPRVVLVMVFAGLVVAGIDWLRLHDLIPTTGYAGIQDGRVAVLLSLPVTVFSRASVPLSAFVDLKPQWLVWAIGLELLNFVVVVSAGAYALAQLLRTPLTTAAVVRYAALVGLFQFGPDVHIEGAGLLVALPVFVIWVFVLVRLFALPGLLITGASVRTACQHSWQRTTGHGWTLVAVIGLLGLLSHLGMSVPLVGPLGSALVAGLHAGTIAVFLTPRSLER